MKARTRGWVVTLPSWRRWKTDFIEKKAENRAFSKEDHG